MPRLRCARPGRRVDQIGEIDSVMPVNGLDHIEGTPSNLAWVDLYQ